MRGARSVVASFAALAASWVACTSFDAAPAPDAGADAEAEADADVPTDAGLDCANAIICDDFEDSAVATAGWPSSTFMGDATIETTTEESNSPTHSLKGSAGPASTRRQAFVSTADLDPATISLDLALFARPPLPTYVNVAALQIGAAGDHHFHVQLAKDGTMHLYEQRDLPDGGASYGDPKTIPIARPGEWRHVRTTVTHSPDGGVQAILTVDGTTVSADAVLGSAPKTRVKVGFVYAPADTDDVSIYLDDIVVRAE